MAGYKVFNDAVHGHMHFHPLFIQVIDTPEFQRLRNLKQTNSLYLVFPGASHNRFEHSIGTCHLAVELLSALRKNQEELNITEVDVLCVGLAGLCHDLGHGPFSHLWEKYIQKVQGNASWKHEEASIRMLDHLIKKNNLEPILAQYGLGEQQIALAKDYILGERKFSKESHNPNKNFLFEIVANKRCGVDVDKWEYMLRDSFNVGVKCNFDFKRYILYARVINIEDEGLQICMRDKEVENLYNMFYNRWNLNRCVYKHKTTNVLDEMICDIFALAEKYILLPGQDNKNVTMSEATINYDMEAYSCLSDHILPQIAASIDTGLQPAKDLLKRIHRRQLYPFIGQVLLPSTITLNAHEIKLDILKPVNLENDDNIIIVFLSADYGMSSDNPIDHIKFYTKCKPDEGKVIRKSDTSLLLPQEFKERLVRVICKQNDENVIEVVRNAFKKWCQANNLNQP